MCSRKDYKAIAEVFYARQSTIRECGDLTKHMVKHMAESIADYFAADNPRFNRAKFLQAAGVQR